MSDGSILTMTVISGINFPVLSRKYLIDLVRDIVIADDSKFIVVAGNIIDGHSLEQWLKLEQKMVKGAQKEEIFSAIVRETAGALNEFLPKIKDINYHVVLAEKIYDRPIGAAVLERLIRDYNRTDIRMFNDPETKLPIRLPGFGEIRVLVPRKTPWFYENVTGLTQRLVNGFSMRTYSPKPPLILVGCTGTGAYLPGYKGVPCISVPTLHKIDEQQSVENMVGCVTIKISPNGKGFDIVPKFYDFRTAVFGERDLIIPKESITGCHRLVMDALKPSSASLNTIQFRVNSRGNLKSPWNNEKTKRCIEKLEKAKLIVYDKKEGRYALNEALLEKASMKLSDLFKDSRKLTFVVKSCWHVGALKTLYFTVLEEEAVLAQDADYIVINGDVIQGISHNYEYNGESILNGPDKQQILAGLMQAKIMADIFKLRLEKIKADKKTAQLPPSEIVKKCLVGLIYNIGNHDEPRFSKSKDSIPLHVFDQTLRVAVAENISRLFNGVDYHTLKAIVDQKIMRVGESRAVKTDSVAIGLKHPRQGGTKNKGARIQETCNFFDKALSEWPDKDLQQISVVMVANFHEQAVLHTGLFGRTMFGIMTGAMVKDTEFENNINKVVEHGLAKVTIELTPDGNLLSDTVEFAEKISRQDEKIVLADKLTMKEISELYTKLSGMFNLPWR